MNKIFTGFFLLAIVTVFTASAVYSKTASFKLSSPAVTGKAMVGFDSHLRSAGSIDPQYAALDKGPVNPRSFPFAWQDLPAGTHALAIILDDPDARKVLAAYGMKGTAFLHWIAADIDPSLSGLPPDASAGAHSFVQGKNGSGKIGYQGPQPPSDFPKDAKKPIIHIYRLKVYALSAPTGLKDGFTLEELLAAIKGKVIGEAQLNISYHN